MFKKLFFFLFFFIIGLQLLAQDALKVTKVIISGNKKTKEKVILRELNFTAGDTILQSYEDFVEINKNRLLSTGLFNKVDIYKEDSLSTVSAINIDLRENWYLLPGIIFEMADRNFNVWWSEQNRDLSRVNYGASLTHINTTGARDKLHMKAHWGFTRKYELSYEYPYLNKANTLGLGGSIFYSSNKTIPYITTGNKTQWKRADDERKLLERFRTGLVMRYRPKVQAYHALRIEFHRNAVDTLVIKQLNPNYFLNGRSSIKFFFAEYDFQYDERIYNLYPQGGYILFANLKKEGFGIFNEYDNLSLSLGFEKYFKLKKRLIFGTRVKGKTNLNRNQVAFANNTGLGWDSDIVSGFELYVIDGTDFVVALNSFRYKILERDIKLANWLPYQFRQMNFKFFTRFNFDTAYVNEPTYKEGNTLNNRWLFGYGPAVDLILFNTYRLSFEYSFNDLGEHGLFINSTFAF